jgi:hypothetical protein
MNGVSMPLIVQRRRTSCCSPVENIPLQAEHHSGRRTKVFAFPPERCSPSERNAVRIHNGMVFAFTAESRSPSTGFPNITRLSEDKGFRLQHRSDDDICTKWAELLGSLWK